MRVEMGSSHPQLVTVLRSELVVMEMHNSMFIWVKYKVRLFLTEEKLIWLICLTMKSGFAH